MQIICYEDDHVDQLRPVTQARPAYAITCASLRLIESLKRLAEKVGGKVSGSVRPYLEAIQKLDFGITTPMPVDISQSVLLVNARLVPLASLEGTLQQLASQKRSSVVLCDHDAVMAALILPEDLQTLAHRGVDDSPPRIDTLLEMARTLPKHEANLEAFIWPHDIVACHMREMPAALQWRLDHESYTQTVDGVFVKEGVSIGDYAAIDTSDGPILLDENVQVGPFCFLSGPVYAGAGTRVIEHAALKDGVALGHTVKIGGEVEASVIEPYTNKQHHGFLGHSYLGSWINLGAGTCNSDLKNTYGKINIQYGNEKVSTGMQFLGCFVGDYSKTAINTSIFTGKVIGVCSMMYGFVTSNVPSYVNYARLFGQTALLPADVMINTQKRMFSRRKVHQRECDKQLIRDMYDLSADEREAVDQDML
jgi:UDP-N-acetylglucosamine diphosphorylase/glucosamine-1-phosphate N-acetyltransferase